MVQAAAVAQPPAREVLNSERIAATFGTYGVEVLEQTESVRVSNLFSDNGGAKTCRTFAVTLYGNIARELAEEHRLIVAGGSIGAVLAAAGWEVRKTHLHYGSFAATARLASLMHVAGGTPLAVHVYALDVANTTRTFEYAVLVEIHHPDYLAREDLVEIYGSADESARPGLAAAALVTATEAAARGR